MELQVTGYILQAAKDFLFWQKKKEYGTLCDDDKAKSVFLLWALLSSPFSEMTRTSFVFLMMPNTQITYCQDKCTKHWLPEQLIWMHG